MTRIESYEDLADNIVDWLKDYYWQYNIKAFVVGVSGFHYEKADEAGAEDATEKVEQGSILEFSKYAQTLP